MQSVNGEQSAIGYPTNWLPLAGKGQDAREKRGETKCHQSAIVEVGGIFGGDMTPSRPGHLSNGQPATRKRNDSLTRKFRLLQQLHGIPVIVTYYSLLTVFVKAFHLEIEVSRS